MAESCNVKLRFGSPQVVVPTCEKHPEEYQNFFCNDCDEFICTECVKTDHRDHDWNTVRKISIKRKSRLSGKCGEIRDGDLPKIIDQISKVDSLMKQNVADRDGEITRLEAHSKDVIKEFDRVVMDRKKVLESGFERKNRKLREIKSKLKTKEAKLRETVCELEGSSLSDYTLLNVDCRLNKVLSIVSDDNIEDYRYSMHFKSGIMTEKSLESLLGTVKDYDDFSLTKIASFKHEKGNIIALEVDDHGNAVLVASNQTFLDTINTKGKCFCRTEIGCDINDFVVLVNGDIVFSDGSSGAIKKTTDNTVETLVETSPLTPEGICLTNTCDDDILVTMSDPSQDIKDSKGLVKMFSVHGREKMVFEYHENGKRLFTLPFRIVQNKNEDICVLDNLSEEQGVLHTISKGGSSQFIYEGNPGQQHSFCPVDVVCDNFCNLIVMDAKNYAIHLLDSMGNFMKYLRTDPEDRKASLSLALYGDILWTGGHSGHIRVYRYSNHF